MVVRIEDLEEFIDNMKNEKIPKTQMSLSDLTERIVERWGPSDYIVKSRLKYMSLLNIIKPDGKHPNFFVLVGSDRKIDKME